MDDAIPLSCIVYCRSLYGLIPGIVEDSTQLILSENCLPPSVHKPQRLVWDVCEKLGKSVQIAHRNIVQVQKSYDPCREKTCPGFPTRSDTNRAVQPQMMARGLKFPI